MTIHYELPIGSFLAVVLVLLPLPWHWKARNVATLSLIAWLAVSNFMRGVNAIVWIDNVRIHDRWWCDITSKVFIGVAAALPACSFCITRNLEHIAATRVAVLTAADKRRRRIIDLCITLGFPTTIMALHYIVQGHRFDIMQSLGCQPATYFSLPALLLVFFPPLILSIGSLIYAALALRHFIKRRTEFERHLRDSQSALNTSRYMRLMALAMTEMLWGTTLGTYIILDNVRRSGLRPWTGWKDVHYNFSRVPIFPDFLMPDMSRILLSWWITPSTAFLFFMFFGFSEEALEGYTSAIRWTRRTILRQNVPTTRNDTYPKGGSLPRFTPMRSHGKSTTITSPDDICLEFPDLPELPELSVDKSNTSPFSATFVSHKAHKEDIDVETSSALSLTYPGTELPHDADTPTTYRDVADSLDDGSPSTDERPSDDSSMPRTRRFLADIDTPPRFRHSVA